MKFHVFHHLGHGASSLFAQLDRIEAKLEKIMALSPEVAAAAANVKTLTGIVPSIDAGMKALSQQVADLKNQIANASPSLSDEDKTALLGMTTDTQNLITTLQADIPANTAPAGTSPAS